MSLNDELVAMLEAATTDPEFNWSALARALQRRGYPQGKDGLKAVRGRLKTLQGRMEEEARGLLTASSKRLFADHPSLESFSWHQYTPYWSDGEPCDFRAYTNYVDINGQDSYSVEDPELREAKEAVMELLGHFDDHHLLFRLFGDHKIVKVTPEGIFVETYQHH